MLREDSLASPPTQGIAPSNTARSEQSFLGNYPLKELGVEQIGRRRWREAV